MEVSGLYSSSPGTIRRPSDNPTQPCAWQRAFTCAVDPQTPTHTLIHANTYRLLDLHLPPVPRDRASRGEGAVEQHRNTEVCPWRLQGLLLERKRREDRAEPAVRSKLEESCVFIRGDWTLTYRNSASVVYGTRSVTQRP